MSSSTLPIEGVFFFTDVDPEVTLKDSRDPLVKGGAIIDHMPPRERRLVAVEK